MIYKKYIHNPNVIPTDAEIATAVKEMRERNDHHLNLIANALEKHDYSLLAH